MDKTERVLNALVVLCVSAFAVNMVGLWVLQAPPGVFQTFCVCLTSAVLIANRMRHVFGKSDS